MSTTERFVRAVADNACGAHGPFQAEDAAAVAVKLALEGGGGGPVAVPDDDPLIEDLGVAPRLASAGAVVFRPYQAAWSARLPHAGVGVTGALVGVAETGTVALAAAPGMPRATSLLPPLHVCLIRERDLVATFADALARVGGEPLPSALTWVSGPSRTGDLEMIITLGIHGPCAMQVVIVA